LRDEQLAEEAVHDAFVRALRHRRGFRGRGSLEGWLFRIVVNESRRRQAAERRASPTLAPRDPTSTNGHVESGALAALVAALPERQRLVLFLRHYADLDYEQIGEVLGIARGTVAATLNHAHTSLRQAIEVPR
jgi:RNA polymerase sigma-70 factor (ECF subfamily)